MDYDFDDDDGDYDNPDETALEECGYDPDYKGICWHIGTEHCSFFCPLHAIYFSDKED